MTGLHGVHSLPLSGERHLAAAGARHCNRWVPMPGRADMPPARGPVPSVADTLHRLSESTDRLPPQSDITTSLRVGRLGP